MDTFHIKAIARRYATAIAASAMSQSQKVLQITFSELTSFLALLKSSSPLNLALSSPRFSKDEKSGVLEDITEKVAVTPLTRQILRVLLDSDRLAILGAICAELEEAILSHENKISATVESAEELSSDQKTEIEACFSQKFGKTLSPSYVITPALIGGIRVSSAGKVFDGSISGYLSRLEEKVLEEESISYANPS